MKLASLSFCFSNYRAIRELTSSTIFSDTSFRKISPRAGDHSPTQLEIEPDSEMELNSTSIAKDVHKHSKSFNFQFNSQNTLKITRQNLERIKIFFVKNKPDSEAEKNSFLLLKKNCQNLISMIDNNHLEDLDNIEHTIDNAILESSLSLRVQAKKLKTICQEFRTIFAGDKVKQKQREISKTRPPTRKSRNKELSVGITLESDSEEAIIEKDILEESTNNDEDSDNAEKQRIFYSQVIKAKLKFDATDPCQKISIPHLYNKSKKNKIKEEQWKEFIEEELKSPYILPSMQTPKVMKRSKSNASKVLNL
ncbi:unnamed protein product [Blepharisma stoltei]|uniref:Uncharacterized protein n=1 Tax=Blepharisma stoltei TaxID=1481888 RepID=A0AAU9JR61_9CILI|nr:unnamed protein product [Blepharisma stoltei]